MSNPISLEEFKEIVYEYFKKNNFLRMFLSDRAIKRRLDKNIQSLFFGDKNRNALGTYDFIGKKINLYLGENVTQEEITNNKNISTIIHEAVHALLRHRYGTGMLFIKPVIDEGLQKIHTPKADFPEIGRGLNEGFTNWAVQQSGLETNSYVNLTEIISIIYTCIGAEKMIPFTSYNYKKICNSLHMSKEFGMEFIRQTDELYFSEENLRDIADITRYFEKVQDALQIGKEEDYEELGKQFGDLVQSSILNEIFTDERQAELEQLLSKKELPESDLVTSFSKLIDDMKMELEDYNKSETLRRNFLITSSIDKLIQSLIKGRLDEPETLEEYEKLAEVFDSIRYIMDENEIEEEPEFWEEICNKITERGNETLKRIFDTTAQETKNGTISSSYLEEELKKVITLYSLDGDEEALSNGISSFINVITRNNNSPQEQKALIKYAISNDCVKDLPYLSIITTQSGRSIILNGSLMIGVIDGKRDDFVQYKKSFRLEKGETYKDKADWTISMDTDINNLARQFEELKEKKMQENPDTKIYILEGIVAFQTKEGYQFYEVTEGEDAGIVPAKFNAEKFIKSMVEEREPFIQENVLPVKAKFGIFTKIRRKLNAIKDFIDSRKSEKEDKDADRGIIITGSGNKEKENLQENLRQGYLDNRKQNKSMQPTKNLKNNVEKEDEER